MNIFFQKNIVSIDTTVQIAYARDRRENLHFKNVLSLEGAADENCLVLPKSQFPLSVYAAP